MEKGKEFPENYDYVKDWLYILKKLGYAEIKVNAIINRYRYIVNGVTTPFNYFAFGMLFEQLKKGIFDCETIYTSRELTILRNTRERLQEYILPKGFIQTSLF